jgi:hypothetical protein
MGSRLERVGRYGKDERMSSAGGVGGYDVAEAASQKNGRAFASLGPLRGAMHGRRGQALQRPGFRDAKCALDRVPQSCGFACRNPVECDRAAVAEMLRIRRGGTTSLASSLAFSNQMALNSALTVRPLALNVALGLIACPLMKVHGVGANRRHPSSSLA